MEPAHLRDDLKMEVIAIVLEWPDQKVIQLHEQGGLEFYVARVIINQIQSNTSPFFKKFRDTNKVLELGVEGRGREKPAEDAELLVEDLEQRIEREDLQDLAMQFIDRLYWYDAEMVRLYLSEGSFGKMSIKTNIPKDSCYWTVRNAFRKLKKMVEAEKPKPLFSKSETQFIQDGKSD
jgi:hypothetical protein